MRLLASCVVVDLKELEERWPKMSVWNQAGIAQAVRIVRKIVFAKNVGLVIAENGLIVANCLAVEIPLRPDSRRPLMTCSCQTQN